MRDTAITELEVGSPGPHESWPESPANRSDGTPEPPRVLRFGWTSVLLVLAFWSVWGLLMGAGLYFSPTGEVLSVPTDLIAISLLEGYLWAALSFPLFALAARVDLGAEGGVWRAVALTGGGLLLAFGVAWFVPVIGSLFLYEFSDGVFAGPPGSRNAYVHLLNHGLLASMLVLATGAARSYLLRYRLRQEEAVRLRAQLAESRLESLRMQLNPHFLFNTMNTIAALVTEDPKGVRTMIAQLSGLLRDTLDSAAEIPVSRELAMVERYLGIVAVRFEGRLETHVALDPRAANALVPNFILQPLVENAVKYGVVPKQEPTLIRVEVRRLDHELCMVVADNGPGMSEARDVGRAIEGPGYGSGLGLPHVRDRLSAMYGDDGRLEISTPPGGGTVAEIRLPLRFAVDSPPQPVQERESPRELGAVTHG